MLSPHYQSLRSKLSKVTDLRNILSLMQWDEETYMPEKSAGFRAQQLATLSGIIHELFTENELGNILDELFHSENLSFKESVNVKKVKKEYDREKKYPTEFVMEMTRTISECNRQWSISKPKNDFNSFVPLLKKLVELKKKECQLLGFKEHPYDSLLDQYEDGNTVKKVTSIFDALKEKLVPLILKINSAKTIDTSPLNRIYPKQNQWDFSIKVLTAMGYDFKAGRQDYSMHPFTTSFSPLDVRITTRVKEDNFKELLWSSIHEGGHALYDQGLNPDEYGIPSGEYCSLAIHESQSRLWENNVGKGKLFWKFYFPQLKEIFSEQLYDVTIEQWHCMINTVKSSLIRTNADELTYHFHIIIRFELERDLMAGIINVEDLPSLWNEKYKSYLGIDVPDFTHGVLQDVHWAHGLFGYFPTYTQGSLYAAQFYEYATRKNPSLENDISNGNFKGLLSILRDNIHSKGKTYNAEEICEQFTGEGLNPEYFINYATKKFGLIYNL
ncbi:MAG: hypothetical protein A3H98_00070 [Bacteroidetes bacterium RIFCSPLOWO2_02_FULL_36_8]|nr:MAG: hypothetical protein A3H98_00070 [Bacteroidetes bacterium RIFCSPLOWO2_02_FULL_36_8]OFY69806.1 MAG: hypothetical protein A3G23_14445 [Bacteroidetes bacterium RIFCSPLOWO2_12_FULL_37_12]